MIWNRRTSCWTTRPTFGSPTLAWHHCRWTGRCWKPVAGQSVSPLLHCTVLLWSICMHDVPCGVPCGRERMSWSGRMNRLNATHHSFLSLTPEKRGPATFFPIYPRRSPHYASPEVIRVSQYHSRARNRCRVKLACLRILLATHFRPTQCTRPLNDFIRIPFQYYTVWMCFPKRRVCECAICRLRKILKKKKKTKKTKKK